MESELLHDWIISAIILLVEPHCYIDAHFASIINFPRSATERSPSLWQELGTVCHQK